MTKKEDKKKRIDSILSAAVDVFIEKGYEGASMNEIAARAGISKGGLYHHFISKDMVLLYANQKLLEPCEELMLKHKKIKVLLKV
jgi:AcrR family transcriptional regulator